ncbi:MAG: hypothetical protein AAF490_27200 [Chloroflexota bacterium]
MRLIYHYQRPFRLGRGEESIYQVYNEEMRVWLELSQTPSLSISQSPKAAAIVPFLPQLTQQFESIGVPFNVQIEQVYSDKDFQDKMVVRLFSKILERLEHWGTYQKWAHKASLTFEDLEMSESVSLNQQIPSTLVHSLLVDQSPSAEQVGGVTLLLEPTDTFSFANGVTLFPEKHHLLMWSGAVREQVAAVAKLGVLEETAVPPLKITLLDLVEHPLDSKSRAFQLATRQAILLGVRN